MSMGFFFAKENWDFNQAISGSCVHNLLGWVVLVENMTSYTGWQVSHQGCQCVTWNLELPNKNKHPAPCRREHGGLWVSISVFAIWSPLDSLGFTWSLWFCRTCCCQLGPIVPWPEQTLSLLGSDLRGSAGHWTSHMRSPTQWRQQRHASLRECWSETSHLDGACTCHPASCWSHACPRDCRPWLGGKWMLMMLMGLESKGAAKWQFIEDQRIAISHCDIQKVDKGFSTDLLPDIFCPSKRATTIISPIPSTPVFSSDQKQW